MVKKSIFSLSIFLIIILLFILINLFKIKDAPKVIIDGKAITVEIANDEATRTQGLSNREILDPDKGMLFIFPQKNKYTFWMKDMHFPLDIIWIDGDMIVTISENLPPEGLNPKIIYSSTKPIDKVLEINAGLTRKLNIKIGDKLIFKNIN